MNQELQDHAAKRPTSPGAVGANHPDYVAYHQALTIWTEQKFRLECADAVGTLDPLWESPQQKRQAIAPLCRSCKDAPAVHGRYRCVQCDDREQEIQRQKKNDYRNKAKKEATSKGMCRKHVKRPAMTGHSVCCFCVNEDRLRRRKEAA